MFNSKSIILSALVLIILVVSVLGGALGASFGFGFLSGPLPFISIAAETIFKPFGYELKNSSVMLWMSMIVLIVLSWLATRKLQEVPSKLQNIFDLSEEYKINLKKNVKNYLNSIENLNLKKFLSKLD